MRGLRVHVRGLHVRSGRGTRKGLSYVRSLRINNLGWANLDERSGPGRVDKSTEMMPREWEFLAFNFWPQIYMVGMAIVGVFLSVVIGNKRVGPVARGVVVFLAVGTVLLHVLTWQILAVDQARSVGRIPLSEPWPAVVNGLILVLFLPGFVWQGFLVGASLLKKRLMRPKWLGASVVVSVYSAWMLPWMVGVIFD